MVDPVIQACQSHLLVGAHLSRKRRRIRAERTLGGVALSRAPEAFFVRRRGLRLAEREQEDASQVAAELDFEARAGRKAICLEDAPDGGAVPEQTLTAPLG